MEKIFIVLKISNIHIYHIDHGLNRICGKVFRRSIETMYIYILILGPLAGLKYTYIHQNYIYIIQNLRHICRTVWKIVYESSVLNKNWILLFTVFRYILYFKVIMQGMLFQRCTHFLYCSALLLGGKVNTKRMSQPDMESIFTKIIYEIFWSKKTIMWMIKIIKIKCFYPPRILDEHWSIYSCLQIPPRENWFQYVHRVYATAINFPCISTLLYLKYQGLVYKTLKCFTWFQI